MRPNAHRLEHLQTLYVEPEALTEPDTFGCAPQASWFAPLASGAAWPRGVEPPLWGHSGREEALMLEFAIVLIVGFGLGYGVREWVSRRRHQAERERRALRSE
jgi:hypothetical protein